MKMLKFRESEKCLIRQFRENGGKKISKNKDRTIFFLDTTTRTGNYLFWLQAQEIICPEYKNRKLFVLATRTGNYICPEEEENQMIRRNQGLI